MRLNRTKIVTLSITTFSVKNGTLSIRTHSITNCVTLSITTLSIMILSITKKCAKKSA
jgi:hypothetical protein